MKTVSQSSSCQLPEAPKFNAQIACAECGAFGAYEIGGTQLCLQCYTEHGSCCPEFEGRDARQPAAAGAALAVSA